MKLLQAAGHAPDEECKKAKEALKHEADDADQLIMMTKAVKMAMLGSDKKKGKSSGGSKAPSTSSSIKKEAEAENA